MVHSDSIWIWMNMNFYVKTCKCSPPLAFFIAFLGTLLFWLSRKVIGPGLQGLHVATPVTFSEE